jgi:hypothetical protein
MATALSPHLLFHLHFFAVSFMTGVIWIIQLIHYPSFRDISPERFSQFHQFHSSQITWVVGPVMMIQLLTAVGLVSVRPSFVSALMSGAFLGLSAAVFFVTAFFSVPAHQELSLGFQDGPHQTLVVTNWIRTVLWSAHSVLCLWILSHQERVS